MNTLRHCIIGSILSVSAFILFPVHAFGAGTMNLTLAPRCTTEDRSTCPNFEVVDGERLKTSRLSAGDILDIDIVVTGSDYALVRTIRAWLQFDPSVLEFRSVELSKELPSPIPGEQTVDEAGRVVKIGGNTDSGLSKANVSIARVTFRVLAASADTTISFTGFDPTGIGQAAVNGARGDANEKKGALPDPPCISSIIGCRGTPQPLLASAPPSLIVALSDNSSIVPSVAAAELVPAQTQNPSGGVDSSASSVATLPKSIEGGTVSSLPSAATATPGAGSVFAILQVQGVKVTTRDTMAFVGWNELKSAGLKGYNVYYSTVSGRYIQRHSVPKGETSVTLRNLAAGSTYYFAVRAVNEQDQESVFSQEVSVVIGKPETASAPLATRDAIGLTLEKTGGNSMEIHNGRRIQGETGTNDIVAFVVLVSALIGTGFAFRRQIILHHLLSHAV